MILILFAPDAAGNFDGGDSPSEFGATSDERIFSSALQLVLLDKVTGKGS